MAVLTEMQKVVTNKALERYRSATEPTEPFWNVVLLAKTKAEQKAAIEPFLLQVKAANTALHDSLDANVASQKSALLAENTTIDQIIAAL